MSETKSRADNWWCILGFHDWSECRESRHGKAIFADSADAFPSGWKDWVLKWRICLRCGKRIS